MKRVIVALAALALLVPAQSAAAAGGRGCGPGETPGFRFGFAALSAQLRDAMGAPASCEYADPNGTGDTLQDTTAGLAFWRKSTNTPTFTNGSDHWSLTPRGFLHWTGSSIDPPGNSQASTGLTPQSPPLRAPRAPIFRGSLYTLPLRDTDIPAWWSFDGRYGEYDHVQDFWYTNPGFFSDFIHTYASSEIAAQQWRDSYAALDPESRMLRAPLIVGADATIFQLEPSCHNTATFDCSSVPETYTILGLTCLVENVVIDLESYIGGPENYSSMSTGDFTRLMQILVNRVNASVT